MQVVVDELQQRWRAMFSALAAGDDLAPARRLRAEGLMEAAVLDKRVTEQELNGLMDACFREVNGHGLADVFGEDWRVFYPFPQIPVVAQRAPVYPSTKE